MLSRFILIWLAAASFAVSELIGKLYSRRASQYLNVHNSVFNSQVDPSLLIDYYTTSVEYLSKLKYSRAAKFRIQSVFRTTKEIMNIDDESLAHLDESLNELSIPSRSMDDIELSSHLSESAIGESKIVRSKIESYRFIKAIIKASIFGCCRDGIACA
jgi:hypothetical protein